MMQAQAISALIQQAIPDAHIELEDLREDGEHFAALVESPSFAGKTPVEQHRMVLQALQDHVGRTFRTMTLKTATCVDDAGVEAESGVESGPACEARYG